MKNRRVNMDIAILNCDVEVVVDDTTTLYYEDVAFVTRKGIFTIAQDCAILRHGRILDVKNVFVQSKDQVVYI